LGSGRKRLDVALGSGGKRFKVGTTNRIGHLIECVFFGIS